MNAIKMPNGAAAEYAKYACNFYKGCSHTCTYCFNNRWGWGDVPKLKSCFKSEEHALEVFEKELKANLPELQKHGLFFTFTSDPFLEKTLKLNSRAMSMAAFFGVPVKVLTKMAISLDGLKRMDPSNLQIIKDFIAFGFTLTGHDELEPGASTNAERIEAMKKLHEAGFRTWASIEPIIDIKSSVEMIEQTYEFCNLYKIGVKSNKKYGKKDLQLFIGYVCTDLDVPFPHIRKNNKFYFKDSLLQQAGIRREELPSNCVNRDYNLFKDK